MALQLKRQVEPSNDTHSLESCPAKHKISQLSAFRGCVRGVNFCMALFRRWFLILFALLLGGGQSFAASGEQRAYGAALQAFHDKFYSVAETRLTQFLQNYRKSTNAPMVVLLLAQSEYYQKNYSAVTNRLADPVNLARARLAGMTDSYIYWRAEAQFAQGDLVGAARTFVSLTEKFPHSPLALNAAVEAAAAFAKLGLWPEIDRLLDSPNGLFQHLAVLDPANEQVANGRLLQSESKCMQQGFAAALAILNQLNPTTLTPEQDWKRAYLLYRANLGINDLDAALVATTNLLQIARPAHGNTWATNLAQSVASHASVLEQQGRLAEAAAALQENLSNTVPVGQQQQTILKLADLAIAQKNLTNAETTLESFLAQFSDSPAADIALLTLGKLHLADFIAQPSATNHLVTAQADLDQFLATTNSPLAGQAYLARGWCNWLANKYPESLADFQSAAQLLPVSEDLAVARFKMGDAQFALTNYPGALTNYQAVLTDFSDLPQVTNSLASRALYQILRAQLVLHDVTGMDDSMRQLLEKFFTSAPTESSMLLAGQGFSDFDAPAKARSVFLGFELEHGHSLLLPEVAFAAARTYEREQNWPAAVTNYQSWLETYPTNELRPQVEYARDWAVSQTGDESAAFKLFSQYPTNLPSLTPLAYWWMADHYFRLGGTNFTTAEYYYQLIFQDFPAHELAYPAQLRAARAAMGRFSYEGANRSYLIPLINDTNCPADVAMQARFAYAEALGRMKDTNTIYNLQLATNILGQICAAYPTNEPGALAWSEIADCDLQLGAYDAATNACAQVLNSPGASQELRNRARVGLGNLLKKKAEVLPAEAQRPLLSLALGYYTDVLYTTNSVADAFWTKEAGLQALPLMMTLKEGDVNAFFNSLEHWLPSATGSLEKKRAALNSSPNN
jgi:TolA-binding protein